MNLSKLIRPLAVALLAAPLLAGCGGGDSTSNPTNTQLSTSTQMPDGLTAQLAQNIATIPASGTVIYTVSLINNTAAPISYRPLLGAGNEIPGSVPASLRITDINGNLVYPLNISNIAGTLSPTATLAPGASVSSNITVGGTAAGRFSSAEQYDAEADFAVATSATDNTLVTTKVSPLILVAQ